MPKDHWRRARDRDIAKRANRELALFGQLVNFERVEEGVIPDAPSTYKEERVTKLVGWLNLLRQKTGTRGRSIPVFSAPPGPNDSRALPLLRFALAFPTKTDVTYICSAVKLIGAGAVKEFIKVLEEAHDALRQNAAQVLGLLGKEGLIAVPFLKKAMCHGSPAKKKACRVALERLAIAKAQMNSARHPVRSHSNLQSANPAWDIATSRIAAKRLSIPCAAAVIPELIALLKTPHLKNQRSAAMALGRLGPAAKAAIPELTEAAKDSDELLRERARVALRNIRRRLKKAKARPRAKVTLIVSGFSRRTYG